MMGPAVSSSFTANATSNPSLSFGSSSISSLLSCSLLLIPKLPVDICVDICGETLEDLLVFCCCDGGEAIPSSWDAALGNCEGVSSNNSISIFSSSGGGFGFCFGFGVSSIGSSSNSSPGNFVSSKSLLLLLLLLLFREPPFISKENSL